MVSIATSGGAKVPGSPVSRPLAGLGGRHFVLVGCCRYGGRQQQSEQQHRPEVANQLQNNQSFIQSLNELPYEHPPDDSKREWA
jgi:hypothetical protein